jgi:hypothetical protein
MRIGVIGLDGGHFRFGSTVRLTLNASFLKFGSEGLTAIAP